MNFGDRSTPSAALAPAWADLATTATDFRRHYAALGYNEQAPAPLVSTVDPTVRFIGSTISVLKSFILDDSIPGPGVFLIQPSLRTRNLERLLDEKAATTSPSFFVHLGTLSPPDFLEQAAFDGWKFFMEHCAARGAHAVMRISSQDRDLLAVARHLPGAEIEVDGEPDQHYRHQFGMKEAAGRNLNWGVRQADSRIANVGNLVIIENSRGGIGVEVVMGLSHLIAGIFGLRHPIMASPAAAAVTIKSVDEIKFADALVVCCVLADAELRPTGRGRGRTMRGYLQALAMLRHKCGISFDDLERAAAYLLSGPKSSVIASAIRRYLEMYDEYTALGAGYLDNATLLREYSQQISP